MKQKILTRVQDYKIELLDFEEDLKGFYELRRDMEDQVLDISRWPVFDIRVSKLKDKFRIHVSMDNMILDGTAICAVLDEWNKLYKGEVLKSDIGKKTFKDYVNYLKTLELSSEYSMAQEYWNKKIVNMPPRPELPLLNKNVNGEFYRLSTVLQKEKWNVLKMLSAKYGITPSNVLLTSFSEVLYRWGKENKFTINLTINKKALLDSGYAKVLGEFTDTILVEVNAGKKRNFIEKCKSIQNELLNNLKYSSYNGVAVQRDWTKEHGFLMGTAFPIVFTSLLGTADLLDMPGKISYGLTQTPQVWLDYQVSEIAGKLYLNWDVLRGKYDDGVIAQMFSCYLDSLEKMTDRRFWETPQKNHIGNFQSSLPKEDRDATLIKEESLYKGFERSYLKNPDKIAIITPKGQYTYCECYQKAVKIGSYIIGKKIVGILMDKGMLQIASILAAAMVSTTYVPIDINNPKERIKTIIEQASVELILTTQAWVKYNIFDINKDIMEQTIAPFSVDIILAANVLHNAKNIHYVLENLKKLLKPNGTIIILEETLEAYTLLTSMEFKDGLTGFTDERAENNQTFFKREQWEGVFKEHKADIVYQFPEKGTPLEMAGQTIYVVRFKENYICPDKNNMLDELERRIPEYMIPSVITFLPRLPQTSNDKIDRGRISKWISASAEENKKVDVAELPQNDLEEQIARIWCKELNIERIGRNDNFYLSGGDSLLIAQVIARMRETIEAAKRWSWDDLLKEMMKTPTIRGVAKILSNQAGENEQDKSLVIIKEAAESSEKKVTVVFHAGTGTLTPYNSLIAYITERSQENEAVMGFTFGDEAEYLAIPTDKIFENLGKKYGRILSELGFTEYTLIGHCVGGLIALETAHYLKDKGKNVSSVTLLSTSIPHKKEETVLADLDMKIFETAVQTSLYNELLLERTFASLIDADIKKAGHQVDNDTLQQVIEYLIFNNGGNITVQALCSLTGKFAEVGAEFQRLHSMSATERMNDLYTTIERPNGQLMEHQRKMLNVLFRVFAQNFRCVSSYIPKVYTGKMRVFDCESAIANFFPSLFSEDKKTWEQYAQGEFLFDTMKGDHISCMNSPYIEENVKKILDL